MGLIYPVSKFCQLLTLKLFADYKVTGLEYVPPPGGPLIIVANHQSNFDPPLISACIPRKTWFLAKDTIFRGPVVSWFLTAYGAFPVKREAADLQAFRWTLRQLDNGQAVVVFPEGTRSRGGLQEASVGVVRLALKSQASLLPIGITGTERLGNVARVFYPTGRIRVNIGRVFTLPVLEGRPNREVLGSLTEMIMLRIAALLPESYHGFYAAKAHYTPTPVARDGGG